MTGRLGIFDYVLRQPTPPLCNGRDLSDGAHPARNRSDLALFLPPCFSLL